MAYRPPPRFPQVASARLDAFRLFLLAQVVLGHIATITYPTVAQLNLQHTADLFVFGWRMVTRFGAQAAVVFVCVSGFFLVPRLLEVALGQSGAEPIGAFLRARLRRIYPTLIVAIVLTVVLDLIGRSLPGGEAIYRSSGSYDYVAALNISTFIGNLLSLQPVLSGPIGSNGPLWTLGYIVQFYVAGAVLAEAFRRNRRLGIALLATIFVVTVLFAPEWAILFACWLGCGLTHWFPARSARAGLAGLLLGTGLFVFGNLAGGWGLVLLSQMAAGVSGAAFLFAFPAPFVPAGPDRLAPAVARVNVASYPFYALHHPLLVITYVLVAPRFDTAGLAFRIAFPLGALIVMLAAALVWQAALERLVPARK